MNEIRWATQNKITIASVVEGQGDVRALPIVIERLAKKIVKPGTPLDILKPHRISRGSLIKNGGMLESAIQSAAYRIQGKGGILVLIDADDDCPAQLGPLLLKRATDARNDKVIGVVLAKREFEAWYLAAANSVAGKFGLSMSLTVPKDAEGIRDAKGWLTKNMEGSKTYHQTVDQPALARVFDLEQARANADSFDKFWRVVEGMLLTQ